MPIIGFKNNFKNFKPAFDEKYIVNFNAEYTNHGSLVFKNTDIGFDVGDLRINIEKVFDEFTKDKFYQYDNGIMILSICKYLVDNIDNIYSIEVDCDMCRDIYFRDEIINDYKKIKGE